jgi:hypothetical protein
MPEYSHPRYLVGQQEMSRRSSHACESRSRARGGGLGGHCSDSAGRGIAPNVVSCRCIAATCREGQWEDRAEGGDCCRPRVVPSVPRLSTRRWSHPEKRRETAPSSAHVGRLLHGRRLHHRMHRRRLLHHRRRRSVAVRRLHRRHHAGHRARHSAHAGHAHAGSGRCERHRWGRRQVAKHGARGARLGQGWRRWHPYGNAGSGRASRCAGRTDDERSRLGPGARRARAKRGGAGSKRTCGKSRGQGCARLVAQL